MGLRSAFAAPLCFAARWTVTSGVAAAASLGEAARRTKAGTVCSTYSFVGGKIDYAIHPLDVDHGLGVLSLSTIYCLLFDQALYGWKVTFGWTLGSFLAAAVLWLNRYWNVERCRAVYAELQLYADALEHANEHEPDLEICRVRILLAQGLRDVKLD